MLKNYFKIAWRNLLRNKAVSVINIVGLAIGIATCLVILLFVNNELSYDRYNKKADRMYAVYFQGNMQGEKMNEASVMPPVAQTLKGDYPEVEAATRLRDFGTPKLRYGNNVFKEDRLAFVDSNFFQVFTLPLVEGNANTALLEPNTVVITRAVAKKYFGNENPLGKIISFKDGKNAACKVTGVIDKVPVASHFHFDLFVSMASLPESRAATWMSSNFFTYIVLAENGDYKKLEAKLPQLVEKYIGPQMQQAMGLTLADFRKGGSDLSFHLEPLTKLHLDSDFPHALSQAGDANAVYVFAAIAVFMLLIACINFMNLSTAGASKRAKEVGIKKVLGSTRVALVKQFIIESTIIAVFALLLALAILQLTLPWFNQFAEQRLNLDFSEQPSFIVVLLLFVLFTGVGAGSYPAFYLSSFKPAAVLKGKATTKKGVGFRSSLVVFQFFISTMLIVCTTVVFKQLSYLQHKDVGYDKEQVLIIPDTWVLGKNQETFYQQLKTDPRVASVSRSRYLPAGPSDNNNFFVATPSNPERLIKALRYDVDENYISTLGIRLAAGRNFSAQFATDSAAVILNETAARALGWGDKAIGQAISHSNNHGEKMVYQVIGVVKDFHFRSLHESISPLVMSLRPQTDILIAKLKRNDAATLIASLAKTWASFGAEDPMSYSFLDERFNNTYKTEQKTGTLLGVFAGLTIFIACLGLFGLAMFTAQQRTKEIGIRKILGASVAQVTGMLSKEFLKLVIIACVIAFPLSWWAMHTWLQNFAYRTHLSWWVFAVAALVALLIAVLTISLQAIKAAIANPVKSLRTE